MKNTRSPKLFKHTALLSLAIFAMASSLLAQIPTHDIVLTENSSTDLSVTFDGSPVMTVSNTAQDRWTVTFPDTFIFGGYTKFWEENPISFLGNAVDASGNELSVLSDIDTGRDPAGEPNGSIQSQSPGASDSGNPVTVNFTFNDIGDGSRSVPDTGFTLGLFFVSLIALLAARRSSVPTA
jgi:hypothetical protein